MSVYSIIVYNMGYIYTKTQNITIIDCGYIKV